MLAVRLRHALLGCRESDGEPGESELIQKPADAYNSRAPLGLGPPPWNQNFTTINLHDVRGGDQTPGSFLGRDHLSVMPVSLWVMDGSLCSCPPPITIELRLA